MLAREIYSSDISSQDIDLKYILNIQGVLVLLLFIISPESACVFAALLLARVRNFYSLKTSIYLLLFTIVTFVISFSYYYIEELGITGIAIFTTLAAGYYIFTLNHSHKAIKEHELRQKALDLNQELLATRELLAHTSRQSERLRISRNIHDLLGHQLTGLILNLEVASHLSEGEAKEKVRLSLSLAKNLLNNLRIAISDMRESAALNFNQALNQMLNNIPDLQVNLSVEKNLEVGNSETAETLIRCIQEALTNIRRHANASQCFITLKRRNGEAVLQISDNGHISGTIKPGNGLKGMMERVQQLSGNLYWQNKNGSFFLEAAVPLEEI